jgi:hypothetical protein
MLRRSAFVKTRRPSALQRAHPPPLSAHQAHWPTGSTSRGFRLVRAVVLRPECAKQAKTLHRAPLQQG